MVTVLKKRVWILGKKLLNCLAVYFSAVNKDILLFILVLLEKNLINEQAIKDTQKEPLIHTIIAR